MVSTCIQISQELQQIFEAKISLHEVIKFINLQTNNKTPMIYWQNFKYFSIELSNMLLGVCDSFEKLGTMGATSSTGIIYVTYKFRL